MRDRFETLRRTIIERPDDDDAYLVLADHLLEVGDPRGELIVLEHAGSGAGEHFQANRAALLGPLADLDEYLTGVRWKLGFVRQASLHLHDDEPTQSARRAVQSALDAPAMALLHRLEVSIGSGEEVGEDADLDRAVMAALCSSERPSVRVLSLTSLAAGRVSTKMLSGAFPNLQELIVACQRISFGGVKSWDVRSMRLFTTAIPVTSFVTADWRALESLSLTASIDGSLTDLLVAAPSLSSFAISTDPKSVEVIGSLLESGTARRLKRLRINPIAGREIEALQREAHRFESLQRLEIPRGHDDLIDHLSPQVEITDPSGETDHDSIGIEYDP